MSQTLTFPVPVIGFAARSGTGKTTLLKQVVSLLVERSYRLAVVKHSHHDFEIDKPGKDSYELHHAGSAQTLITSSFRSALIQENTARREPELQQELRKLDPSALDLVLVEGFRDDPLLQKIELLRPSLNRAPLFHINPGIIAVASDATLHNCELPQLDLNTPEQIVDFIIGLL